MVLRVIADANTETMTADAAAKEIAADVTITQEATAQTTMDVTADRISVQNPDLNRDLLCSIRMQAADVRNHRIKVVTVNKENTIINKRE